MKLSEIKELYYIAHIDNIKSILQNGILCYNKAKKVKYTDIADGKVQSRREKDVIPSGKHKLHDYANMYFNARNAMMSKRRDLHKELCIFRINPIVLKLPNVIISDKNASSGYVRFYETKDIDKLDVSLIFTEDWRNGNTVQYWIKKSASCAEVLFPDCVNAKFITGIYVSCQDTFDKLVGLLKEHPIKNTIEIKPKLFFQE
jgi:hypothetical protein